MTEGYNTDLMLAIREHIRANPEQHDQNNWGSRTACGTTHCIAGWAAALSGAVMSWEVWCDRLRMTGVNGVLGGTPRYAAQALGLTRPEWEALFFECDNAKALDLLDRMIEAGKNSERVEL